MISRSLPHLVQTLARRLGPKPFAFRPLDPDLPEPTWQDLYHGAWALARHLVADGLEVQEKVALFADDSVEALVAEVGVQAAGGTLLLAPGGATVDDLGRMLELTHVRCFLHDEAHAALAADLTRTFTNARTLRLAPLEAAPTTAGETPAPDPDPLASRLDWLGPGSPALVLFPGHRADGLGVIWTQANLLGTGEAIAARVQADMDDTWLSLGPLEHPFLRVASWYAAVASGGTLCLLPPETSGLEMLWTARPTFAALPADAAEPFQARIAQEVAALPGLAGRLARWGFEYGRDRFGDPEETGFAHLRARIAETLRNGRLRELTGGALRAVLHGWGPPPEALVRYLGALGTTVHESWGLPETAGCCALAPARPGRPTWGIPLDGVDLRIEPDGRIAVGGHSVFHTHSLGNAKDHEWHATGRMTTEVSGELDPEGRLILRERTPT
jgi:long-chain acyl-CoA synthetase